MKENLAELVKKEFETLSAEKIEIERKLAPLIAFMNTERKGAKTGEKRGRKGKSVNEPQIEV